MRSNVEPGLHVAANGGRSGQIKLGEAKPRGRSFQKGRSGNPAGRPKGARNRGTLLVESLLDQNAERITNKLIELACKGDVLALRLCIERVAPIQRERPLLFELPALRTPADAVAATQAVAAGVSSGELSGTEASTLVSLVEVYCKAYSQTVLEDRLAALEASLAKHP